MLKSIFRRYEPCCPITFTPTWWCIIYFSLPSSCFTYHRPYSSKDVLISHNSTVCLQAHASCKMKARLRKLFVVCCSHELICLDVVEIATEYNSLSFWLVKKPLYPELNGKCAHCSRKHVFLHFPLISLPSQEALTWVVHQFKRVDFFFFFFSLRFFFFFFLSPSTDSYCDILGQSEMKDIHAGMQYL